MVIIYYTLVHEIKELFFWSLLVALLPFLPFLRILLHGPLLFSKFS